MNVEENKSLYNSYEVSYMVLNICSFGHKNALPETSSLEFPLLQLIKRRLSFSLVY